MAETTESKNNLISSEQGKLIIKVASTWAKTPYVYGGMAKKGADCSGSTYQIYKEAGFPYDRQYRSSSQFSNNPKFKQLTENFPQEGDVAWWSGHVAIYAGNGEIWTATHTGGPAYHKDSLRSWEAKRGKPKWYR
jgi:cell wall-associated NlpC family hydrolase